MNNTKEIRRRSGSILKLVETLIYILIVNGSYFIVLQINCAGKYDENNLQAFRELWLYITICSIIAFLFTKIFRTFKLSKIENILVVISATLIIAFSTMVLAFAIRSFALPRSVILLAFLIQTILISTIKIIIKVVYGVIKKPKNVIVFCELTDYKMFLEKIFGSNKNLKEKVQIITSINNFDFELLNGIDKVYICDVENSKDINSILDKFILRGIEVCVIPRTYELVMTNANLYLRSDIPMLKIDKLSLSTEYKIVKRFIDITLSVLGILFIWPIMVAVALAIFISDRGNPIYKQKRVTLNNREFYVYKFRTMIIDAEKKTGAVWAIENDERITKIGGFLRKYWLDELPQLFNILKGDMSVVGPRPERPELIKEFVKDYPEFKFRTYVKCGLTGYAQVMALYDTTPKNKLKFDLFYILNADLFMDLNIILLTTQQVVLRLLGHKRVDMNYNDLIKKWSVCAIKEKGGCLIFEYHN